MKSLEEVHESSQSQLVSGKAKKWFHPGSNRGPSLRESDVITNYTMKPSSMCGSIVWSRGSVCVSVCVHVRMCRKKRVGEKKVVPPRIELGS